jgi:hypothetical protein
VKHVLRNVNHTPIWTTVKGVHRYVEDVLWNVAKCNSQELINYNLRGLRSIGSDSINAEIEALGNDVFVTWWENNQTSNDPVMRISQDGGSTFGLVLRLAANDTLRATQ